MSHIELFVDGKKVYESGALIVQPPVDPPALPALPVLPPATIPGGAFINLPFPAPNRTAAGSIFHFDVGVTYAMQIPHTKAGGQLAINSEGLGGDGVAWEWSISPIRGDFDYAKTISYDATFGQKLHPYGNQGSPAWIVAPNPLTGLMAVPNTEIWYLNLRFTRMGSGQNANAAYLQASYTPA